MKYLRISKKSISFLLVLSLLFSVCVWSIPVAHAVTGPSSDFGNTVSSTSQPASNNQAKYRVRLLIHEDDGFDKSIHDNASYVPGITYGVNNSKRNLNGTSTEDDNGAYWCEYARINYKDFNGTGTAGAVWFNLGDKDAGNRGDIISSGGQDYGYFPSDDGVPISGFPTSFTTRYYEKGNGSGGYTVYLQVAVWTSSTGWEWSEGTCTGTGFLGIGGWDSKYAGGILSGATGSVSTDKSGTEIALSKSVSDTSVYPQAQASTAPTCTYNLTRLTCPATASAAKASASLQFNSPTDQYGAVMAAKITTACTQSATGITQSGKTTSVAYSANLAGDVDTQTVTATVTWPQVSASGKLSASALFEVNDATYDVIWKNHAGMVIAEDTYAFGNMPLKAVPEREYDSYHYTDGTWDHAYEAVSDTSNNVYTAVYTELAHQYEGFVKMDSQYHRGTCYVDGNHIHTGVFAHDMAEKTVAPTCENAGYTEHYCTACDYHYETDKVPALGHAWNSGEMTAEPTCFQNGWMLYTCQSCGAQKTERIGVLEHELELVRITPEDKTAGGVYYTCTLCHKYWAAVYSERLHDYDIPDDAPLDTPEQAMQLSDTLPEPFFNILVSDTGYNYASRGASLRYIDLPLPDYQPLRFTSSVRVPEGVDWRVGAQGNVITDMGIVYSQTQKIGSIADLQLGKENVYAVSVKDKNSGLFTGSNWVGVSVHEREDGIHLSMNLVVSVKPENWTKDYCARAYITYTVNGYSYTVYDEAYSSRSVEYVARQVIENPDETPQAKEYCQKNILNNIR